MMKKIFYFVLVVLLLSFVSSCVWTEPYEPLPGGEDEGYDLVLKSASGFNSAVGDVYLQRDLNTLFSIYSRSDNPIETVIWKIEGTTLAGKEIIYRTNSLGQIPFEVDVSFKDGTSQKKAFAVFSVIDLNQADPVQAFVLSTNGTKGEILFLFSKERISQATGDNFYYNGSVSNWVKKLIPEDDHNYIISGGVPTKTTDVGKYIGVRLSLDIGEHSLALVHSDNEWANLSGSRFIKKEENTGMVIFSFDGSKIIPLGDNQSLYPGNVGDAYFRFSNNGNGTIGFFFKFDEAVTSNSFISRRDLSGNYFPPIQVSAVSNFPQWGVYSLSISGISEDILYFRYGANKNSPLDYAEGMKRSNFYNEVFNALRVSIQELE